MLHRVLESRGGVEPSSEGDATTKEQFIISRIVFNVSDENNTILARRLLKIFELSISQLINYYPIGEITNFELRSSFVYAVCGRGFTHLLFVRHSSANELLQARCITFFCVPIWFRVNIMAVVFKQCQQNRFFSKSSLKNKIKRYYV